MGIPYWIRSGKCPGQCNSLGIPASFKLIEKRRLLTGTLLKKEAAALWNFLPGASLIETGHHSLSAFHHKSVQYTKTFVDI